MIVVIGILCPIYVFIILLGLAIWADSADCGEYEKGMNVFYQCLFSPILIFIWVPKILYKLIKQAIME